jgi:hypothetical protein
MLDSPAVNGVKNLIAGRGSGFLLLDEWEHSCSWLARSWL